MKIWLAKNSEISLHDQLVAQISLGIASRDLQAGEKLPSTRELARRFQIHPNTVSAAYRELTRRGAVEFKKGSGVFVCENSVATNANALDQLITRFLNEARANGFELKEIQTRLEHHFQIQPPKIFLVAEDDDELRRILIEEINAATDWKTVGASFEDLRGKEFPADAQIVALIDEKAKIQAILPSAKNCIYLRANSVADSMKGKPRPTAEDLIAVVSNWEKFLRWAKTFLLAANLDAENLLLRSPRDKNWRKGLPQASLIICDLLTARKFADEKNLAVFRVIADDSIEELKKFVGSLN